MAQNVQPIWKDLKYTYPGTPAPDYLDYILRRDSSTGEIIFTGRAYKRPGETTLSFSVNSIVASFLRNEFPFSIIPASRPASTLVDTADTEGAMSVWIAVKTPNSTAYGSYSELGLFQNDWSYYGGKYYSGRTTESTWGSRSIFIKPDAGLTLPDLVYILDWRLPFVRTTCDQTLQKMINNVVWHGTEAASASGQFTQPDGEFAIYRRGDTCFRYVLYFLSAFGGWSFTYLEAVTPEQNYDRKTAKRVYDSSDLKARGIQNYINEVACRWKAKSPYLIDSQAAKMWHVTGTTSAYLFDMETGTWTPVNVENSSWDGRTYRNQGAKRVRYDITLTLAQDRLRRL